jgi:hypothetical protein
MRFFYISCVQRIVDVRGTKLCQRDFEKDVEVSSYASDNALFQTVLVTSWTLAGTMGSVGNLTDDNQME